MALPELFSNYFKTSLSAGCTSSDGQIEVNAPAPTNLQATGQFRIIVDPDGIPELMLVTADAATQTWAVTRAIENTTAVAHNAGVDVIHIITAGAIGAQTDAAGGVPSLRSLGTGASQAAAGTAPAAAQAGAIAVSAQRASNLSDLGDAGTSRVNIHVPSLTPAACVVTTNVASLSGLNTYDTYTLTAGDLVLLTGQSTASQNGLYIAAAGAWSRPTEMATNATMKARTVAIIQGASHAGETWLLQTNATVTVDTTAQTWVRQFPVLGVSGASQMVTAPTTIAKSAAFLLNPASAAFSQALPDATAFQGVLFLSIIGASTNVVTLTTVGGQTVENFGSGQLTLGHSLSGAPYNSIVLNPDGSNWRIVATKENRLGEMLSLSRDFALNTSMSASTLLTKIASACVSAVSAGRPFLSLDSKMWNISGGPLIMPNAAFSLCGGRVLENYGPGPGNPAWMYPQGSPPFIGGGLTQMDSAADILQIPVNGPAVDLESLALVFNTPYLNTGNGITAKPPNDVGGFPDFGVSSGSMIDVKVFGPDAYHYGFEVTNQFYATWHRLRSYGGGGLHFIVNSNESEFGNIAAVDCAMVCYIGGPTGTPTGTSHAWYFDAPGSVAGVFSNYMRCQGFIATPFVQPAGTVVPNGVGSTHVQKCRAYNGTWNTQIWTDQDMEGGLADTAVGAGNLIPSLAACPAVAVSGQVYNSARGAMQMLKKSFTLAPLPSAGAYLYAGTLGTGISQINAAGTYLNASLQAFGVVGQAYSVCTDANYLYVVSHAANEIMRLNLDGTIPAGNAGAAAPIVAAAGNGPWGICNNVATISTLGETLSTTGGAITTLSPVTALTAAMAAGSTFATDDGFGHVQIWTVGAAGAALNATSIPVVSQTPTFNFPIGTTTIKTGKLFWCDTTDNTIWSANIDGTSAASLITGANTPRGICTDGTSLYWCNAGNNTVGKATVAGASVNQSFATGLTNPTGIAINGSNIYVSNFTANSITQLPLTGGAAGAAWVTGLSGPQGLALDSTYLYVAQFSGNEIARITLAGPVTTAAWVTGITSPTSVCTGNPPTAATVTSFSAQNGYPGAPPVQDHWSFPAGDPAKTVTVSAVVWPGGQYGCTWQNAAPVVNAETMLSLVPVGATL